MEARSLASLNLLAGNPPQYPYNPTEERQQHLTLYISRVPGTRDVILSPFKPQRKNVTVEDVASSLYYIHLDTSDSAPPSPSKRHGLRSSIDGDNAHKNSIPRKPVPGIDHPVQQPNPHPLPQTPPESQAGDSQSQPDDSPVEETEKPQLQQPLPKDRSDLPSVSTSLSPTKETRPVATSPTQKHTPDTVADEWTAPRPPEITLADSGVGLSDPAPAAVPGTSPVAAPAAAPVPAPPPVTSQDARVPSIVRVPTIQRKPLPPIPRNEEPFTSCSRPYSEIMYHQPQLDSLRIDDDYSQPPQTREDAFAALEGKPRSAGRPRAHSAVTAQQPRTWGDEQPPSPRKQPAEAFTLRIIRRDPSSGNQWNVGTVASSLYEDDSQSNGIHGGQRNVSNGTQRHDTTSTPRPPLDIVIETSGYAKFRNMPASQPRHLETGFFSRQVCMSYTKSWSSTLRDKLNGIDRASLQQLPRHLRNGSVDSGASSSMWTESTDATTTTATTTTETTGTTATTTTTTTTSMTPGPGMKARGYVFQSPWDGRCEFRTGNGGRSLTCRHVVHDPSTTAAYNPLVAEQGVSTAAGANAAAPIVSELRFNLPNADLFPALSAKDQRAARQKLGNLRKLWKRDGMAYDSSDYDEEYDDEHEGDRDDDEVSPFDVNLGRERAGGGNRGKRAKLGKLIVTSEGLKMLDLIVAANIGVWWGAWEKTM